MNALSTIRKMVAQSVFLGGLFLALANTSQAALILSLTNTTIDASGSGTVDLILTNDSAIIPDPDSPGDLIFPATTSISFIEFDSIITPIAGGGQLVFTAADPAVGPDFSYENDANYLFLGDGLAFFNAGASTTTSYRGEDETDSGNSLLLTIGQTRLVARLAVNHILDPGQSGSLFPTTVFTVGLNEALTGIFDFNDLDNDEKRYFVSSSGGQVTVIAVPEPGTMLALCALSVGYVSRRRNRVTQRIESP